MHTHFDRMIRVALIALSVLILVLGSLLLREYGILRAEVMHGGRIPHSFNPRENAAPLTDASLIQSWMTYDYIGHVYGLPLGYLASSLSITDSHYPRESIAESAEALHMSVADLTAAVRASVSDYLVKKGT